MTIIEEEERKLFTNINLGLVTASFAVFLGLLRVNEIDTQLLIALVCFSLIFPINIYFGFVAELFSKMFPQSIILKLIPHKTYSIFTKITVVIATFGIINIITHISINGSKAFIIGTSIVIIFSLILRVKMEKAIEAYKVELKGKTKEEREDLMRKYVTDDILEELNKNPEPNQEPNQDPH